MKKILLAIALAAFAVTSQAQSNVSVYGILDVGYMGTNSTGTIATTATSNYAVGIRHTF